MEKTFDCFKIGFGPGRVDEQTIDLLTIGKLENATEWLRNNKLDHYGYVYEIVVDEIEDYCDNFEDNWYLDPVGVVTAIFESGILEDERKYKTFMAMVECEGIEFAIKEVMENPARWDDGIYYYGGTLLDVVEADYEEDEETRAAVDEFYGGDCVLYAYYLQFDGYHESPTYGTYLYNK